MALTLISRKRVSGPLKFLKSMNKHFFPFFLRILPNKFLISAFILTTIHSFLSTQIKQFFMLISITKLKKKNIKGINLIIVIIQQLKRHAKNTISHINPTSKLIHYLQANIMIVFMFDPSLSKSRKHNIRDLWARVTASMVTHAKLKSPCHANTITLRFTKNLVYLELDMAFDTLSHSVSFVIVGEILAFWIKTMH